MITFECQHDALSGRLNPISDELSVLIYCVDEVIL